MTLLAIQNDVSTCSHPILDLFQVGVALLLVKALDLLFLDMIIFSKIYVEVEIRRVKLQISRKP
jgi:hypothetical protein